MRKPTKALSQPEVLQGTLDMLVLKTLASGPAHGQTIAKVIERGSGEFLQIDQGSLYPALYRLEDRGCFASFWRPPANNPKPKYYRLPPAGRKPVTEPTVRRN